MTKPIITLIAAVAEDGTIGVNGDLPWPRLQLDMAHFRQYTRGKPVVMGRATWDSLPEAHRPLPDRTNVVLTRNSNFSAEGAEVVHDAKAAISACGAVEEICIIGGEQIYSLFLEQADKLVLTEVEAAYPDGDAHFPNYNQLDWIEIENLAKSYKSAKADVPSFKIRTYERRT